MGTLFAFTIKAGLVIATLFAVYKLITLRYHTARLCRVMLMGILLLSPLAVWIGGVKLGSAVPEMESITLSVGDTSGMAQAARGAVGWPVALVALWLTGCIVVALTNLLALLRLRSFIRRCRRYRAGDITVAVSDTANLAPFSTARSIVVSRTENSGYLRMILHHEAEHIRLRHWIDLAVARLATVVMWYNPVVWLLSDELKQVHEYEVDGRVIDEGIDVRSYQYMLLAKSTGLKMSAFVNNLNDGSLKRRIKMMASRRRRNAGLSGVLILMTAGLFIASAADALPLKSFDSLRLMGSTKPENPWVVESISADETDPESMPELVVVAYKTMKKADEPVVVESRVEKEISDKETVPENEVEAQETAPVQEDQTEISVSPKDRITYFVNGEPVSYEGLKSIETNRIAGITITKNPDQVRITLKPDSIE